LLVLNCTPESPALLADFLMTRASSRVHADFELNTETFDVFEPGDWNCASDNSIILASRYHLVAI
jgi:hypothetical protein